MNEAPHAEKLLRWLAMLATPLSQVATHHSAFYAHLHPHLLRHYEEAGHPYGTSEVALWRWWEELAARDRERWLGQRREAGAVFLANCTL